MTTKKQTGEFGERIAAEHLEGKGYTILARNYRYKHAEIDLIAQSGDWLIFVEVKTRASTAYGYPEDFVDYRQQQSIFEAAMQFMHENDWQGNVRYDIVSIILKGREVKEVVHLEDAFY